MKIARALLLLFVGLLAIPALRAQTITTVTGTVLDPSGVPFAFASVNIILNGVAGQPSPTVTATGSPVVMPVTPTTNGSGTFSANLVANASITPASTNYTFRVCASPAPAPLTSAAGNNCVTAANVTIAGASQDLSATFAAIPPPALIAAGNPARNFSATLTANAGNIAAGTSGTNFTNGAAAVTYRITCELVITQAATTSSTLPQCNAVFTDNQTSTSETVQCSATSAANTVGTIGAQNGVCTGFLAKPSTTVGFSTSGYASSGATPMQYAANVHIEVVGAP